MTETESLLMAESEARVESVHYFTVRDGVMAAGAVECHEALSRLTLCALVLDSGFVVLGQSAVLVPEDYDAETGRRRARMNAYQNLAPLVAFTLLDKILTAGGEAHRKDAGGDSGIG